MTYRKWHIGEPSNAWEKNINLMYKNEIWGFNGAYDTNVMCYVCEHKVHHGEGKKILKGNCNCMSLINLNLHSPYKKCMKNDFTEILYS